MSAGRHNVFKGTVSSRSSRRKSGPPGETEIQRLNPQRVELLLKATGWGRLEPGSLNIEADEQILKQVFDKRKCDIFEPADSVRYPDKHRKIPLRRKGYCYYHCFVKGNSKESEALVRRAVNPLKCRVELFAPINLREALNVQDGDQITIQIAEVTE